MTGVAVHTFPSGDDEFRETTQRLVADAWSRLRSADALISEVQGVLRERYPDALVRLRDAQAELGDPLTQMVYAFRDGRAA